MQEEKKYRSAIAADQEVLVDVSSDTGIVTSLYARLEPLLIHTSHGKLPNQECKKASHLQGVAQGPHIKLVGSPIPSGASRPASERSGSLPQQIQPR